MSADTPEDRAGLRRVGGVVAEAIEALAAAARPGVTTAALDDLAREVMRCHGARSGPVLTYRYPGAVCLSVDDEIVHAIPGPRRLRDGQLLTIDVALELDGYHADSARTVSVGEEAAPSQRIRAAAKAALAAGIRAVRPGATLRDVGGAVERATQARGFRVVRELTGHGIGRRMHEAPTVYNWAAPQASATLTEGLVFTIEPMIVAGRPRLVQDPDGWTLRTADGALSAHEEDTVMVGPDGAVVLTAA